MTRNQPPATFSPPLSSEERRIRWHRYPRYRLCWLAALAVLFVAVIVVGILFAAHKHYHDMGGQGFLKTRRVESPLDVCLPLRKTEIRDNGSKSLSVPSAGLGEDVPFYACGDQQNSCEAFGQPAICCPVRTACNPTTVEISPSGVFCCNSALNPEECFVSIHNPPVCMAGTTECSRETGGGCCPENTICSPNGCIHAVPVWIISSSVVAVGASSLSPTLGAGDTESLATITKTVTERPAATATMVKDGEVAQSGVRKDSVILSFPYAIVWMLVCVAALMRLL